MFARGFQGGSGRLFAFGHGVLLRSRAPHRLSQLHRPSTMQASSQRLKGPDGVLSTLNVTIEALNVAKEICSITSVKAAFGSVGVLLTMIRVCFPHSLTVGSWFTFLRSQWSTKRFASTSACPAPTYVKFSTGD